MNKIKSKYAMLFLTLIVISQLLIISAENTYTKDYSITESGKYSNAQFTVQTLKYEPYPINAGDTFDLWVKIQNIGQSDAKNAYFKLSDSYPFSSDDRVREFGIIPGTISAYSLKQSGDINIEANQVLMKFRVKVANDAPEGENIIKLEGTTNKDSGSTISYSLPITIKETKTDFEVKVHGINPQETSFVITNIGKNTAGTVLVDIKDQDGITILPGAEPNSLGDIKSGDFTVSHLKIVPKEGTKSLKIEISYTDTAGIRNKIEKEIALDKYQLENVCIKGADKTYLYWVYGSIGFLTGAFIVILVVLKIQKKKTAKNK